MLKGMEHEEDLIGLRNENAVLRGWLEKSEQSNAELRQKLAEVTEELAHARARIAGLEQQGRKGPPPFVKENRPTATEPKPPRRKRAPEHNHGRRRETPTQIVQHALERCPECNYQLRGKSIDYTRQVIELPEPQPVDVIEHQVIKRYCPHCQRWQSPRLDLRDQVFGQGRMGLRLVSMIAYLRQSLRLPVRRIRDYLETCHRCRVSIGEIVELLHDVRQATAEAVTALKQQMQRSTVVHADETGWREKGRNGFIWSFSTPGEEAVRYYEYDASRAQTVVKRILAAEFKGHLVSDFYAGYNAYAGRHQRCWTHLLRDLHELKEKHPDDAVVGWARAVRTLYDAAQEWLKKSRAPTRDQREKTYVALVARSHQVGLQYARMKGHPCWALSKRLLRHEDELFQFVLIEGLSADNNLAERSIRPLVVIRKISGGSRGDEGTKTRMALASLFGTWRARGVNEFSACYNLLTRQDASPT